APSRSPTPHESRKSTAALRPSRKARNGSRCAWGFLRWLVFAALSTKGPLHKVTLRVANHAPRRLFALYFEFCICVTHKPRTDCDSGRSSEVGGLQGFAAVIYSGECIRIFSGFECLRLRASPS